MERYLHNVKTYLGSVTWLSLTGLVTNAALLLAGLVVARRLNTADYGQYAYLSSLFLLFTVVFGFGLTGQISKDLAERTAPNLPGLISGQLALRLATALPALLGGLFLSLLSGNPAFGWAGAGAVFYVYSDFMVGALSGLGRVKSTALSTAVQPLSFLLLVLVWPVTQLSGLYAIFLLSQGLAALAATLLALGDPLLRVWPRLTTLLSLRWKEMIAGWLYLLLFLQIAYNSWGVTALGTTGQYDQAGAFSIAFTIVQLPNILIGLVIAKLYYPRLCHLYKNGSGPAQTAAFGVTYYLCGLLSLGYSALVVVYADVFVDILYSSQHAGAVEAVRWLAALSFFLTVNQVLSWTLVAANRQRLVLSAAGLSLLLLLIQLLLPLSAPAMALAYITSSLAGWLLMLWRGGLGQGRYSLWLSAGGLLIMGLVGVGLALAVRYFWPVSGWALWQLGRVGFAGLLYLACSLPALFYIFRRFVAQPLPANS